MSYESVIIFGYNDYAKQIAKQIKSTYSSIQIFTLSSDEKSSAIHDGFTASLFDLGDEWEEIEKINDTEKILVYCALQNDEQNTFLTISLHASFDKLFIVALANDLESSNKLKIAGASKVLSIVQTTSDIIAQFLEKPILTDILHNILFSNNELALAEVAIQKQSSIIGIELKKIDLQKYYNILILSVSNSTLNFEYIFTAKGSRHKISEGDILVIIGYTKEIEKFKYEVNHSEINWSNRSW